MSIFIKKTFSSPKKFLISNKSYSFQYFSALSSVHNSLKVNNNVKTYAYIKINKLILKPVRRFSMPSVHNFYESISSTDAVKFYKNFLIGAHDFTGFSWTVIIIGASALLKLLIAFPCGIYQKFLNAKLEFTTMELKSMKDSIEKKVIQEGRKHGWTKAKLTLAFFSEMSRQKKVLVVKNNCHPFKLVILSYSQIPFWLLMTVTIRKLTDEANKGYLDTYSLRFDGPFWCPNLCLPDFTFIIPTVNFLALLACVELFFLTKIRENKPSGLSGYIMLKVQPFVLRLFSVLFFFISANSPSGLSLFWMSSSLIGLAQNLLFLSPKVMRFFKVPKTPFELDKPYSEAWNKLVGKFKKFNLGKTK